MELFFQNVDFSESGCWLWKGPTCSGGRYGRVNKITGPTLVMAHRMAYLMLKGVPNQSDLICHTCENGLCVNPAHMFLGTPKDNSRDMAAKGRGVGQITGSAPQSGENNSNAKLTRALVEDIRAHFKETGCTCVELMQKFGLRTRGHAYGIVTYRIWK